MKKITVPEILEIAKLSIDCDNRNEYLLSLPWAKEARFYNFIYELCRELQPKTVVEIGVMHGTGAAHFMWGSPHALYWGVDLTLDRKQEKFQLPEKSKGEMKFFLGDSIAFAEQQKSLLNPRWPSDAEPAPMSAIAVPTTSRKKTPTTLPLIDILFIDGEHTTQQCLAEYHAYGPLMAPDSLILFDDILMGGMEGLWEQISEPKVIVPEMHGDLGFGVAIR